MSAKVSVNESANVSVKWGFLGAGYVANQAMGSAVHAATNAQLFGVASRDKRRSKKLKPVQVYDTYQQLLDDPQIDAVYISLANHQHLEWVTKSLEAGKHVLCEKPLGLRAAEVQEMMACAQRCERFLVEAVWSRWHPRFAGIAEVVASGEITKCKRTSAISQSGYPQCSSQYNVGIQTCAGKLLAPHSLMSVCEHAQVRCRRRPQRVPSPSIHCRRGTFGHCSVTRPGIRARMHSASWLRRSCR